MINFTNVASDILSKDLTTNVEDCPAEVLTTLTKFDPSVVPVRRDLVTRVVDAVAKLPRTADTVILGDGIPHFVIALLEGELRNAGFMVTYLFDSGRDEEDEPLAFKLIY